MWQIGTTSRISVHVCELCSDSRAHPRVSACSNAQKSRPSPNYPKPKSSNTLSHLSQRKQLPCMCFKISHRHEMNTLQIAARRANGLSHRATTLQPLAATHSLALFSSSCRLFQDGAKDHGLDPAMLAREAEDFNAEISSVFGQDVTSFDSSTSSEATSTRTSNTNNSSSTSVASNTTIVKPVVSYDVAIHVHLEDLNEGQMEGLLQQSLSLRVVIKTSSVTRPSERRSEQVIPSAIHVHFKNTAVWHLSRRGLSLDVSVVHEER